MKFELKQLDLTGVADAIRRRIHRNIVNSGKWNKTGHLLRSLRSQVDSNGTAAITVANDRLQDDFLAQRFLDEIVPNELDRDAMQAIGEAVRDALVIEDDK